MTKHTKNSTNETCYGLHKDRIVHINSVQRGLDCNCICPNCEVNLIAKKGDKNSHHFAHENHNGDHCNESILHKLGKQIIEEFKYIALPEVDIIVSQNDLSGKTHSKQHVETISRKSEFTEVRLEQSSDNIRPDLTCLTATGPLYIEIVVTNPVCDEKIKKVIEQENPMLSIDLSQYNAMLTYEDIKEAVLKTAPRTWIYNPEHEKLKKMLHRHLCTHVKSVNEELRQIILEHFEIEQFSPKLDFRTKPDRVILLGFSSAEGYSTKKRRDFDYTTLYVAKPVSVSESHLFVPRGFGGYEEQRFACEERLIPQLSGFRFPCEVILNWNKTIVNNRPQEYISTITIC